MTARGFVHAWYTHARVNERRAERKFNGRWCYNLRESSRNRARVSFQGTLDSRFAGYRCRTSKEGALVLSDAMPWCSLSLSLSFSLFPSFHLSRPLTVSAPHRLRHENVVRPWLRLRRPSAGLKREMPQIRGRRHKGDETSLTEFGKANPG